MQLIYAYDATRRARLLDSATPDSIRALASTFDAFNRCHEPFDHAYHAGRTGPRLILRFRPQRRMHQIMVADLLRAIHPPLPSQYLFGGGMPAAITAVEAAIAEGFHFGAELDVSSFYASVRYEGLVGSLRPLPTSVVENVVWDRGIRRNSGDVWMAATPFPTMSCDPSSSGLVGLAAGSACSPIVGEKVIGKLLAHVGLWRTVAYADNIFVFGRDRSEVAACTQLLRERALEAETGPLELRSSDVYDLMERFEFLGMHVEHRDGLLDWAPSYRRRDEFLLAHRDDPASLEEITAVERRMGAWRRAYPRWRDGASWESRRLGELEAIRYFREGGDLHLSRAATALALAIIRDHDREPIVSYVPDGVSTHERNRRQTLIEAILALLPANINVEADRSGLSLA